MEPFMAATEQVMNDWKVRVEDVLGISYRMKDASFKIETFKERRIKAIFRAAFVVKLHLISIFTPFLP